MRVSILCHDEKHHVRAFRDGVLDAVARVASTWEILEIVEHTDGTVSFRTLASHPLLGRYVRAVAGGGGQLVADRTVALAHEKFKLEPVAGARVAIRTHNGNYWRAIGMGGDNLDATASVRDTWETFRICIVS